MNTADAERLQVAILAAWPKTKVVVTPYDDGAEIRMCAEGQKDRLFKTEEDYLTSPIIRLLIGDPALQPQAPARRGAVQG
jgi:hypothetical protein